MACGVGGCTHESRAIYFFVSFFYDCVKVAVLHGKKGRDEPEAQSVIFDGNWHNEMNVRNGNPALTFFVKGADRYR